MQNDGNLKKNSPIKPGGANTASGGRGNLKPDKLEIQAGRRNATGPSIPQVNSGRSKLQAGSGNSQPAAKTGNGLRNTPLKPVGRRTTTSSPNDSASKVSHYFLIRVSNDILPVISALAH